MKSDLSSGNTLFFIDLVLFIAIYLFVILLPFPALEEYTQSEGAIEIFDGAGTPLYVAPLEDGMRRLYRPLEEIPPDVRRIFTLAEDKRFFLHPGVDFVALSRAAVGFVLRREGASGASTITMQLARMVLHARRPRNDGLFARKIREIVTAFRIEARFSKEQILELWLNNLPFGYQTEGVTAAARRFFNGDLYSLTKAQVLSLALIPRNPTAYNPVNEAERVCAGVLRLADRLGIILDSETACRDIAGAAWGRWPDEAPHFSRMVAAAAEREGVTRRVATTLDLNLQRFAEGLLQAHLDKSAGSRIENGAVLLIENGSGSILAYLGSQGFRAPAGGQIDGVLVENQPGSTIKPFLYACALENGFRPNDLMADIPTDFGTFEIYVPRNFDRRYHGPVRLRTSLASSLNVPAVLLLEFLGVRNFSSFLRDLGFDSITGNDPSGYSSGGLGMALGNVPVSLYELVRAFSVFPRDGMYLDLTFRSGGENRAAGVPQWVREGSSFPGRRVISESTAWILFDMLSDPAERVAGFGLDDPFRSGVKTAVKTGTSSKNQNIWALAATREYTVGVWLGNFAGQTVIGRTGSSLPAQMALDILAMLEGQSRRAAARREPQAPYGSPAQTRPAHTPQAHTPPAHTPPAQTAHTPPAQTPAAQAAKVEICSLSGMVAGPHCPGTRYEYAKGAPPPPCTFHPKEIAPFSSVVYPAEFASWAEAGNRNAAFETSADEALQIRYPVEGAVYFYDKTLPPETQAVKVEVLHGRGKPPMLSVNGNQQSAPGSSNGVMSSWIVPLVPGTMLFEVVCDGESVKLQVEVL